MLYHIPLFVFMTGLDLKLLHEKIPGLPSFASGFTPSLSRYRASSCPCPSVTPITLRRDCSKLSYQHPSLRCSFLTPTSSLAACDGERCIRPRPSQRHRERMTVLRDQQHPMPALPHPSTAPSQWRGNLPAAVPGPAGWGEHGEDI